MTGSDVRGGSPRGGSRGIVGGLLRRLGAAAGSVSDRLVERARKVLKTTWARPNELVSFLVPTSPNFVTRTVEGAGTTGVSGDAEEVEAAFLATVDALLEAVAPEAEDSPQAAFRRFVEERRAQPNGQGLTELAADMARLDLSGRESWSAAERRSYRTERRALERLSAMEGRQRHSQVSETRLQRFRELVPQRPSLARWRQVDRRERAGELLAGWRLQLQVHGDWRISEDDWPNDRVDIDESSAPGAVMSLIASGGRGLQEVAAGVFSVQQAQGAPAELVRVLAIRLRAWRRGNAGPPARPLSTNPIAIRQPARERLRHGRAR